MAYTADIVRLKCDLAAKANCVDIRTQALPQLYRGADWRFECAFTIGDAMAEMDLATVTLDIKSLTGITGSPLVSKTLSAGDLTLGATYANWLAGTAQHAVFELANADTNLDLGGASSAQFFASIKGWTSGGQRLVLGVTRLTVIEGGINDADPPTPGDSGYYIRAEIDALLASYVRTLTAQGPLTVDDISAPGDPQHKRVRLLSASAGATLIYNGSAWEASTAASNIILKCESDGTLHKVVAVKQGDNYLLQIDQNAFNPE